MSQYKTFDHFARDLFLCRLNSELEISEKKLKPIPIMNDAEGALDYFHDGHASFFREIFDDTKKNYGYRDFQSDEEFLKFAIPRCLKLIDKESKDRYFYSMMLVASFLLEFLLFLKDTRYCLRFCLTAHKCFSAVFKRAFEDDFETHGGLEGLAEYSKKASESVDSVEKYESLPNLFNNDDTGLVEKVVKLIKESGDVDDESFLLNDYELSLLKDDGIDEVLQSLEKDTTDEDPLNLQWPPCKEEMQEKLRAAREAFARTSPLFSPDSDGESMDYSMVEEFMVYAKSDLPDLFSYVFTLEREAQKRLGCEAFKENMKLRNCPCCGIKCFQFSLKLYLKQLDSALVENSGTEVDNLCES